MGMHATLGHFVEKIKAAGADPRTLSVVEDGIQKIELFDGHRLRVTNQQRALDAILNRMSERAAHLEGLDEALVVIDFKLKAEPIYFREKTLEHYGKREMSWHGAMVRFWAADEDGAAPSEQKIYFNHISSSDNKQDKEAVA